MSIRRACVSFVFLTCFAGARSAFTPDCDSKAVFEQVNKLLSERNYDEAGEVLDQSRACIMRSSIDAFQTGWLYGRARRFEDALKIFRTVPANFPDPLTHDYAIALSEFELGQFQKAIDVLNRYCTAGTADSKTANLLAVSYSKLGLYRQAYTVLLKQSQKDSNDLSIYLNMVTVCAEGGDVTQASQIAAKAREQFPSSADVIILQGAANTLLGHLDEAYSNFAESMRLAPQRADARFFLALVEFKQARFQDAISILKAADHDGIVDPDLHYLMAECLLKLRPEDTNGALSELHRAIALNADSVSARTLRGKLLLDQGRAKEALADLELAAHEDPDSRTALYNLARAYRANGRPAEAQAIFDKLREQSSNGVSEFADKRLNGLLKGSEKQDK